MSDPNIERLPPGVSAHTSNQGAADGGSRSAACSAAICDAFAALSEPERAALESRAAARLAGCKLGNAMDLLEQANHLLGTARLILDGWPAAEEWHREFERFKGQNVKDLPRP